MPIYLLALTVLTFIVYGLDKYRAQHEQWRISEATLLMLAAVGGSLGAWMAMYFFRHKTHKRLFTIGVPSLLTIQIIYLLFIYSIN